MPVKTEPESAFVAIVLPVLYFFGRIVLFLGLVPDTLYGMGDVQKYFQVASLNGWPYFSTWSEYPPLFPIINALIYRASSGKEVIYDFLLVTLISLAGAFSLGIFYWLAVHLYGEQAGFWRTAVYFAILAPLPYTWWYFDLIPVCLMLAALWSIVARKTGRTGLFIALGMLVKWFPGLLLAGLWRFRSRRQALFVTGISIGMVALVFAGLYLVSPRMTAASLSAQSTRTSWETVWALVDGNQNLTGEFIALNERFDPALVGSHTGQPPKIPTYISLPIFLLIGLLLYTRIRDRSDRSLLAFIGLTWIVFLCWLPGWSPQWVLYLVPLILLTLPIEKAILWLFGMIILAILEWPIILGHQLNPAMIILIPARTLLFLALGWTWFRQTRATPEITLAVQD
jgi:hypothetical protein